MVNFSVIVAIFEQKCTASTSPRTDTISKISDKWWRQASSEEHREDIVMIETTLDHSPLATAVYIKSDLHSQTVRRGINWIFAITIVGLHLGALATLFYFQWSALVVFFVVWILAQNVGIAMGYHRLLTHRGYSTPKWLEYCIATCGALALQGGPIYWVAVHRMHHRYTDKRGDPHSPRDGNWWSHMGWILNGSLRNETETLKQFAPDITR